MMSLDAELIQKVASLAAIFAGGILTQWFRAKGIIARRTRKPASWEEALREIAQNKTAQEVLQNIMPHLAQVDDGLKNVTEGMAAIKKFIQEQR